MGREVGVGLSEITRDIYTYVDEQIRLLVHLDLKYRYLINILRDSL